MSVKNEIIGGFERSNFPFLTLQDIYDLNPLINRSSIRSALYRNDDIFERVEKGVYFYDVKPIYGFFRHAKRITDTNKKNAARNFDLDIEMTCEGYAPVSWDIEKIEDIVNPKLVARSLEVLNIAGIYLQLHEINFVVIGSEWRRQDRKDIDYLEKEWLVEVKMVNNVGAHYVFKGEFYVHGWK